MGTTLAEVELAYQPGTTLDAWQLGKLEIVSRQKFPDLQLEMRRVGERQKRTRSFIEFELPNDAAVTLQLFDASRLEMYRPLENAQLKQGRHQVTFTRYEGMRVPSLYRLSVKSHGRSFIDVKRLY